jgi:hypothetical protein
MQKITFSLLVLFISLSLSAQYNYRDANRIGITIGANQFDLNTDNFPTNPEIGWNAGLSIRGNFYNNWDMVYALQFSETNFTIPTTNAGLENESVNYKLAAAQIALQLSYVIIENHLTLEIGPLVQVNGKFKIDTDQQNNAINGTTLLAKDIVDISKFNFYPTIGVTAGVKHFRVNLAYQYGINNMLDNLNKDNAIYIFKGNASIVNANVIFYL